MIPTRLGQFGCGASSGRRASRRVGLGEAVGDGLGLGYGLVENKELRLLEHRSTSLGHVWGLPGPGKHEKYSSNGIKQANEGEAG